MSELVENTGLENQCPVILDWGFESLFFRNSPKYTESNSL